MLKQKYYKLCARHLSGKKNKENFRLIKLTKNCDACIASNEYNKRYYKLNKQKLNDYKKDYHLKNRKKILKRHSAYNHANKTRLSTLDKINYYKKRIAIISRLLNIYKNKLKNYQKIVDNNVRCTSCLSKKLLILMKRAQVTLAKRQADITKVI